MASTFSNPRGGYASGTHGDDEIEGSSTSDQIDGGTGDDVLTGGGGSDTFIFNLSPGTQPGHDRILDFQTGSDVLRLDVDDPSRGLEGNVHIGHEGNDIVISFLGGEGSVTLVDALDTGLHLVDFELM